jgi:hypothetical protein
VIGLDDDVTSLDTEIESDVLYPRKSPQAVDLFRLCQEKCRRIGDLFRKLVEIRVTQDDMQT